MPARRVISTKINLTEEDLVIVTSTIVFCTTIMNPRVLQLGNRSDDIQNVQGVTE